MSITVSRRSVNSAWPAPRNSITRRTLLDVDGGATGDPHQLIECGGKDRERMPAGGPYDLVLAQPVVHQGPHRGRMPDGRDAADRLARGRPDELRCRPPYLLDPRRAGD